MDPVEEKLCKRCVLPERIPTIVLDDEGICNICRKHEKEKSRGQQALLETEFVRLLQKQIKKNKGNYDCLVMCSGGKDSTASLYYMKKRYGLNPLAYTFDHGFEAGEALANIKRATDTLGVDHILYKSNYMHKMFADVIEQEAPVTLCHLCSIWYMGLTLDVAARFGISVIVAGWTKGQSTISGSHFDSGDTQAHEHQEMSAATDQFLKSYLPKNDAYKGFCRSMNEVLLKAAKRHKSIIISPHWFLPFGSEEYTKIIEQELGWKAPSMSYPAGSTNCRLNFLSVHYSLKHFGTTHYHIEMSKLIREGMMTREEALESLQINFDRQLLEEVAGELGIYLPK